MGHRSELGEDIFEPDVAQHQRVAAGNDDVADLLMSPDVIEAVLDVAGVDLAGVADLALPGAEPAVGRATVRHQKEKPVGIPMDDAGHGRIVILGQRVGDAAVFDQFGHVRDDLAVNRIALGLDQAGVIGRDLRLEMVGNPADLRHVEIESAGQLFRRP